MAISPMYFQPLSPSQANPLLYGLQQGTQIAGQNQQNIARQLQNQQLQAQLPYAGDMAQANLATAQQQAPYVQSQTALNQASLPYMGYKLMAPYMMAQAKMGQTNAGWSNNLRMWLATPAGQQWMKDDPQAAQSAINAMNTSAAVNNNFGANFGVTSLSNSTGALGVAQPPPGSNFTNPGTLPVLPGGTSNPQQQSNAPGMTINPQQQNNLLNLAPPGAASPNQQISNQQNVASLEQLKKTTDPTVRQKALYAANIDKTLGMIDPDALTQYAGTLGGIQKTLQAGLASSNMGLESKNYDNYLTSAQSADLLSKQVRQFYGDSIQPSVQEDLQELSDPATWSNNPALAKSLFNNFSTLLHNETATYRGALQGTAPYQGQPQGQQMQQPMQQSSQTPSALGAPNSIVKVQTPDGKVWHVSQQNLKAALARGATQL